MAKIDITWLRTQLGSDGSPISQAELAKRLGVHQATVSRWETGEASPERYTEMLIDQLVAEINQSKDELTAGTEQFR